MSRKDYIAIAKAFKDSSFFYHSDPLVRDAYKYVALKIAYYLASDNDRFDIDRFLIACGLKQKDNG